MFTNKYSEGYAGRRYYEGQQVVDRLEPLAIERAKALFGAEHANVQPYSGSPANLAAYVAYAEPGDTVMGMALPMGGHLTHGWDVSVTGMWFRPVQYGVRRETGRVDLDDVRELARRERPKLIFCGGTAVPRTIDFEGFAEIAREVGAVLVADIAHIAGLVAGGVHPSPVGHADVITTTTHKTLRGPRGAMLMCDAERAAALDRAVFPGLQGGPHNHTTAAIAVALEEALHPRFADYAAQTVANAQTLAEGLTERGFELVSGGTDNHLILIDLTNKGVAGKEAAKALDRAGIDDELQHRAVRSAQAVRPVGHPRRHAGGHHARDGRAGDGADRRVDRRRCTGGEASGRVRARADRRAGPRARGRVPDPRRPGLIPPRAGRRAALG